MCVYEEVGYVHINPERVSADSFQLVVLSQCMCLNPLQEQFVLLTAEPPL